MSSRQPWQPNQGVEGQELLLVMNQSHIEKKKKTMDITLAESCLLFTAIIWIGCHVVHKKPDARVSKLFWALGSSQWTKQTDESACVWNCPASQTRRFFFFFVILRLYIIFNFLCRVTQSILVNRNQHGFNRGSKQNINRYLKYSSFTAVIQNILFITIK